MFQIWTIIFCAGRYVFMRKYLYSVKQPLSKRPQTDFQDRLSLNAGQKYCRMLQGEHSAILLTFIKLPFVIKIFVLSIFECGSTQVLLLSYNTYLTELGLPLFSWSFSICFVTFAHISSGSMSGTSLIENFPITFLGITVLPPGALKAPSIPE